MATRPIVPRGDGEGSLGTSAKNWGAVWTKKLNNVDVDDLIANKDDYRQPNTAYTVGTIKYHHSLPTGYYLECTTAGITGSGDLSVGTPDVYDTLTDGTVNWTVCNEHVGAFNTKETFTSSGTFVAPVSGTYRITLQGGGGSGGGSEQRTIGGSVKYFAGGGGGQGGHIEFYEKLTAGTAYNYTIGAGGSSVSANNSGNNGGATSITVNSNAYIANGGYGGYTGGNSGNGGQGGSSTINGVVESVSSAGGTGQQSNVAYALAGGVGGGAGGAAIGGSGIQAYFGGGGQGGGYNSAGTSFNSYAGGDGYITFEYCNV